MIEPSYVEFAGAADDEDPEKERTSPAGAQVSQISRTDLDASLVPRVSLPSPRAQEGALGHVHGAGASPARDGSSDSATERQQDGLARSEHRRVEGTKTYRVQGLERLVGRLSRVAARQISRASSIQGRPRACARAGPGGRSSCSTWRRNVLGLN